MHTKQRRGPVSRAEQEERVVVELIGGSVVRAILTKLPSKVLVHAKKTKFSSRIHKNKWSKLLMLWTGSSWGIAIEEKQTDMNELLRRIHPPNRRLRSASFRSWNFSCDRSKTSHDIVRLYGWGTTDFQTLMMMTTIPPALPITQVDASSVHTYVRTMLHHNESWRVECA